MARPVKSGIDYFPMDVSFFSDSKIESLISTHGASAPLVYLYVISKGYEENGYFFTVQRTSAHIIAKNLMLEVGYVEAVIRECLNVGLFDFDLYSVHKLLTSVKMQKVYQEAVKARSKRRTIHVDAELWLLTIGETASWVIVGSVPGGRIDKKSSNASGKKKKNDRAATGNEHGYDYSLLEPLLTASFDEFNDEKFDDNAE